MKVILTQFLTCKYNRPLSFLLSFLILSIAGKAQSNETAQVVYDPLFWKDELRLSTSQERKIQEINFAYYEGLIAYYKEHANDLAEVREFMEERLAARSVEIWNTFLPKQRRKWERLNEQAMGVSTL